MAYKPRGPRDWWPGMKPGIVKGDSPGEEFHLRFLREIKSKKDLPKHPIWAVNNEIESTYDKSTQDIELRELYIIDHYVDGRRKRNIGQLIWFPMAKRGAVASWEGLEEGDIEPKWTDAVSELDVLERWVAYEMTDIIEEEEAYEGEQLEIEAEEGEED